MRRFIMKMLLASNDILALQPVTARLVTCGIPIALLNPTDIASYLEVWIQRDSDFSRARTLLPTGRAPQRLRHPPPTCSVPAIHSEPAPAGGAP